jgi:hypothetical protein
MSDEALVVWSALRVTEPVLGGAFALPDLAPAHIGIESEC